MPSLAGVCQRPRRLRLAVFDSAPESTECAIASSTETGSSSPTSDIPGWLVFPGAAANSFGWCLRGTAQRAQQDLRSKCSAGVDEENHGATHAQEYRSRPFSD